MSDTPALHNRIALVTGASRGIGRAIAIALAEAGADVAVNYHRQSEAADKVVAEIESLGRRAIAVAADVADESQVAAMVRQVGDQLGDIGILVNNAGIARAEPVADITKASWDQMIAVNLTSAFLVTQAVLGMMRKHQWGRIINLSSVAAQNGGMTGPHYSASKAGLLGLTHSYAAILLHEGITANAIAPAAIDTDMIRIDLKATADRTPLGRFGSVQETADVAVMLATNGFITGQTINVNGGWYMS